MLGAASLLLVTAVPCAYLDFGSARPRPIGRIYPAAAEAALAEGHFGVGSMAPKVQAGIDFVRAGGARCIICAPENLRAALAGDSGTRITGEPERGESDPG